MGGKEGRGGERRGDQGLQVGEDFGGQKGEGGPTVPNGHWEGRAGGGEGNGGRAHRHLSHGQCPVPTASTGRYRRVQSGAV